MRYWRRRHEAFDLESELRAGRPEPAPELISRIEARVRDNGLSRVGSLRVAFVGALTGVMLLAVASVGGVGYASSAARDASGSAKRVLGPQDGMVIRVIQRSPAIDQYNPPARKAAKKAKKAKAKKKKGKAAKGRVRARTRPPFTG
jgi:hypothetical protein